jgi:hypothetical protein
VFRQAIKKIKLRRRTLVWMPNLYFKGVTSKTFFYENVPIVTVEYAYMSNCKTNLTVLSFKMLNLCYRLQNSYQRCCRKNGNMLRTRVKKVIIVHIYNKIMQWVSMFWNEETFSTNNFIWKFYCIVKLRSQEKQPRPNFRKKTEQQKCSRDKKWNHVSRPLILIK